MGFALRLAQIDAMSGDGKPLKGFGDAGVVEIVEHHDGNAYRAVYWRLTMPQDVQPATRQVLFNVDVEETPYGLGGSLFVVSFGNRCFAVTCMHVLGSKGQDIHNLIVYPSHMPVKGMCSLPITGLRSILNEDLGELRDIAVIEFDSSVAPEAFGADIYHLNDFLICRSEPAERLRVCGFLQEKGHIDYDAQAITAGFCDITCTNLGALPSDPFLIKAVATYGKLTFGSFNGLSGSPVFNLNQGRLTGMIVRAGLKPDGTAALWYVEILHVLKLIEAVSRGAAKGSYSIQP